MESLKKTLISFCFCELTSACNYSLNGYFIPTSGKRDRNSPLLPPFGANNRGDMTLVREPTLKSETEAGGTCGDGEAADGGGS